MARRRKELVARMVGVAGRAAQSLGRRLAKAVAAGMGRIVERLPVRRDRLVRAATCVGIVAGGVAAALIVSGMPRLLAKMEAFRVSHFSVAEARFLGVDEALRWARIPADASVWDDPSEWEERLRGHPLVEAVEIRKDLPRGLVFHVREKDPVALFPRPTLEPVDAEGRSLPVDPSIHRLDLPVIRPAVSGGERKLATDEVQALARELGRLERIDPRFVSSISELALQPRGDVVATLLDPGVELRFRPPLTTLRLEEAMQALAHASDRVGADGVTAVDLRYDDQIVVRLASSAARRSD